MNHLEYLYEQGLIVPELTFNEESDSEGKAIAKKLGIRFVGYWKELEKYLFNDDDGTGTSFAARDEDEAETKLKQKYKEFGMTYAG